MSSLSLAFKMNIQQLIEYMIVFLTLHLTSSPELQSLGKKIRGKFDRFGKRGLTSSGPFRHPDSLNYYYHEDGAKIIKESRFEAEYELGRKIAFLCTAIGFPRPQMTWLKEGVELYDHNWLQIHEWLEGNDTIKSKMEIDPATQADEGIYECVADNRYAIDRRRFRTYYDEMD